MTRTVANFLRRRLGFERLEAQCNGDLLAHAETITRLKRAIADLKAQQAEPFAVVVAAEPPQWDGNARSTLAAYLASEGGKRFLELASFYEQAQNRSVVLDASANDHRRGYAAGFHAALAWLQKLSANVPPHPDDHSEIRTGTPDLAERYAP